MLMGVRFGQLGGDVSFSPVLRDDFPWHHAKGQEDQGWDHDEIIEMAHYGNEIRNEIQWAQGVGQSQGEKPFGCPWSSGIGEHSLEKSNLLPQ